MTTPRVQKCHKPKSKRSAGRPRCVNYECDGLSIEWLDFDLGYLSLDLDPDGPFRPITNGYAFR